MNFPWPLSKFRDITKRHLLFRQALQGTNGKSDALHSVRYALRRSMRPSRDERAALNAIDARLQDLGRDTRTITLVDGHKVSLAQHALNSSSSRPWTDVQFQLARVLRPKAALELGSNVGMSGSAIASALRMNGEGHLWTIDGIPDLTKIAQESFAALGLSEWATPVNGWFKDALEPTLKHGPFQLVLIDGHHDGDATVEYYKQIKPRLAANSVILFDDIKWSRGMQAAWKEIQADKDIRDTCEIEDYGVVAIW